jgi:hypothetical protein
MVKIDKSAARRSKPRAMHFGLLLVRLLLVIVGLLILLIGVAWAFGAIWFNFPVSALRRPLAAVFGVSAIGVLFLVRPLADAARGCLRDCARGRLVAPIRPSD